MSEYIWHKSNYKMMKGKWKIAILLEAGYREVSDVADLRQYRRLVDRIYFQSSMIPYPKPQYSQTMLDSELEHFCDGLKMTAKYICSVINVAEDVILLINLRYIAFRSVMCRRRHLQLRRFSGPARRFIFPCLQ